MNKYLIIDAEKCTGCNSCVLACSFYHFDLFSFAKSRIQVKKDPGKAISKPQVCIQCEEAPCISACPTNALSKDQITGAIRLDKELCIGCRACVTACPYGGVLFDEDDSLPLICDLCDGNPACIEVCQLPQAIRYEAIDVSANKKQGSGNG